MEIHRESEIEIRRDREIEIHRDIEIEIHKESVREGEILLREMSDTLNERQKWQRQVSQDQRSSLIKRVIPKSNLKVSTEIWNQKKAHL